MYLGECWSWLGRLNRLPNTLLILINVIFYLLRPLSHLKFNIKFTQCSGASGPYFWNSVDFDHRERSSNAIACFRSSLSFYIKFSAFGNQNARFGGPLCLCPNGSTLVFCYPFFEHGYQHFEKSLTWTLINTIELYCIMNFFYLICADPKNWLHSDGHRCHTHSN